MRDVGPNSSASEISRRCGVFLRFYRPRRLNRVFFCAQDTSNSAVPSDSRLAHSIPSVVAPLELLPPVGSSMQYSEKRWGFRQMKKMGGSLRNRTMQLGADRGCRRETGATRE